jgi:hypothetical protein
MGTLCGLGIVDDIRLGTSFQQAVDTLCQCAEIIRNIPRQLLPVRTDLNTTDQILCGLILYLFVLAKRFLDDGINCNTLFRRQAEGRAN